MECGTYRGEGLATLAWLLREIGDRRRLFGCDSFQGFPEPQAPDMVDRRVPEASRPGYFAGTSEAMVRGWVELLGLTGSVALLPGYFDRTLPQAAIGAISVLILDCDLYDSYRTCLRWLYPKVQPGGWMVFDEYFSPKYPGPRVAVDEFFADKPEKPRLATHLLAEHPYERWYAVKSP